MSQERLYRVVVAPLLTEKSQGMADRFRQVAFKVLPDATKHEIKQAVELLFKVKVENVQTLNFQGKVKRYKQKLGTRSDWKKAYVTLAEGNDINFASAE